MDWTELFCDADDFCQLAEPAFIQRLIESGELKRRRTARMSNSEIMTIVIYFHMSGYRTFKKFYQMLKLNHKSEFPKILSYNRFVERMQSVLSLLCAYLQTRFGEPTGIAFVDATSLAVCGNKRIKRNRVFDGFAETGKTTIGWFYGFKLHVIINDRGDLLAAEITPGNTDDRKPVLQLAKGLTGKLFGDKGYISKDLFENLWQQGLTLITTVRKNMKNRLLSLVDKIYLRKRSLIETVNDQFKNISQIEHTRHRSVVNFMVNLVAGLISYTHQAKKPSLRFAEDEHKQLNQLTLTEVA